MLPNVGRSEMTNRSDDRVAFDLHLLVQGFKVSRMLGAVANLTIADRIAPEVIRPVVELAAECGVRPEPLRRILRALAAFQVFRFAGDDVVAHTPRSLLLRSDAPNTQHHAVRAMMASSSWRAWEFLDAALEDKVPHEVAWGATRFNYLRDHPEEARIFDAFMAGHPDGRHSAFAQAYDFSGTALIADIGGGNGETLRQILTRFPNASGLAFDREDVVATITPEMRAGGRIRTQGGSFFDHIPTDASIYVLMRILHDWSDEDAVRILVSCRAAMGTGARLLIVENLLEPDPSRGHPAQYLMDMQMMVIFGHARERTEAEFQRLLAAAGLRACLAKFLLPRQPPVRVAAVKPGSHDFG
jgi:hypothetical protein